jgi:hypothetical protein
MIGVGTRKTDATGRVTGRRFGNRRTKIGGQFVAHRIDMLRSPAWCALSLSARRVLDRIEIELADHGGADNGKLPVTYDDFEKYGLHRHAIGPAMREAVALGFVEITEAGRAGNAEFRKPNLFRLTYLPTTVAPTDEWQRIHTDVEAAAIASAARRASAAKIKFQWRKTPNLSGENRHRKPQFHSAETATTGLSAETATTSISTGGNDTVTQAAGIRCNAGPSVQDPLEIPGFLRRITPQFIGTSGIFDGGFFFAADRCVAGIFCTRPYRARQRRPADA